MDSGGSRAGLAGWSDVVQRIGESIQVEDSPEQRVFTYARVVLAVIDAAVWQGMTPGPYGTR